MNELIVIAIIVAVIVIAILVLVFNAKASGKNEAELDASNGVLDDVKKANEVSKSIDGLSDSDKRERLRKFTR